jgi:phosphopantetheinyl transferase (holo-ACP synthase)
MRKKSKYKPRPVLQNPLAYVIASISRADTGDGEIRNLRLRNHLTLESLRTGKAVAEDFKILAYAFDMAMSLAKQSTTLGGDWFTEIVAGRRALDEATTRGLCTGPQLMAINTAMEIHDLQLDVCTVQQLEIGVKYSKQRAAAEASASVADKKQPNCAIPVRRL